MKIPSPDPLPNPLPPEAQAILLELQVHQEQLIAQNEQLREVQSELELARQRYESLYDQAPVGYLTVDRYGLVLDANQTATRILACERRMLVGFPLRTRLELAERGRLQQHLASCLRDRSTVTTELSFSVGHHLVRTRATSRADGQRVLMTLVDITELSSVRRSLEELQAVSQAVMETSREALLLVTDENTVEACSPGALDMFGYAEQELVGQPLSLIVRAAMGVRRDGSGFPIEVGAGRLPHQSTRVITVRDVSERRHLEQVLLDLTETQRRQVGQELHDGISQELSGVLMLLRTHAANCPPGLREEAMRIFSLLERAAQHTSDLARGMYPVALEMHGLAGALQELVRRTSEAYGVDCRLQSVGAQSPAPGVGIHLYRIAQEAVHNAVRHAHARHIEVTWAALKSEAELTVHDDGAGFDPALRSEGVGLSSMRHRAQVLGSRLSVESAPGQGTTVRLTVPLARLE